MSEPQLPEVIRVEVAKLALQPGDTLVVRCPHELKVEQGRQIAEHLKNVFPGHKILVFPAAFSLEIVRPGEQPKP